MPKFGSSSRKKLETCHEDLQLVLNAVIEFFDVTILYGHRTPEQQQELYAIGRTTELERKPVTTKDGVNKLSMHNHYPSKAVDIAPWPIDWNDTDRIRYMAGMVMGMAAAHNIKLRWGGDWDMDTETKDNTFEDLLHFEVVE
jgi:hypothetical protein